MSPRYAFSRDLCPSPVLAIGMTGRAQNPIDDDLARIIETTIEAALVALRRAFLSVVEQEISCFSTAAPVMRLISTGADGADRLGVNAALSHGLEIVYVLPFPWGEYSRDFAPAVAAETSNRLAAASSKLELPGLRSEGIRAYDRANDVLLSNIDLLLAIWDGHPGRGQAEAVDAVRSAVSRGIPVILIDPHVPDTPSVLVPPPHGLVPSSVATLERRALGEQPTGLIQSAIAPPSGDVRRQGLIDLLADAPAPAARRFEYPLLLRTLAGKAAHRPARATDDKATATFAQPASITPPLVAAAEIERVRATIDGFALYYGQLFRSSSAGRYLYVVLGVWLSGVFGLIFPQLAAVSIILQLLANVWVLSDSYYRSRRRWQERWLDYRVVAERLRWLLFRGSFGLEAARKERPQTGRTASWTDWYLRRLAIALGPPDGKIDATSIAASAAYLTDIEIPGQLRYHRKNFRQLDVLEKRLACAARLSLAGAVAVAALLGVIALLVGGLDAVSWKPLAIVMLTSLPATMTGLEGIRVDADLVRLVEGSAQTITLLRRIKRAMLIEPPDYDNVAHRMQQLAAVMENDLAEWRFAIESRRSRESRRGIRRKQSWRRMFRGA
jgi:hypothetical protein